jgi:hypothetical protein
VRSFQFTPAFFRAASGSISLLRNQSLKAARRYKMIPRVTLILAGPRPREAQVLNVWTFILSSAATSASVQHPSKMGSPAPGRSCVCIICLGSLTSFNK